MTNVAIRAGGAPVQSEVLVSVDGTSIAGNGSARDPLHSIGAPDVEPQRVGSSPVQPGEINATVPLTFGSSNTGIGVVQFNLADGETDGYEKTIALNPTPGATMRVNATFAPTAGYDRVNFPAEGGGMVVVWDGTNEWWDLVSTYNGTPA